VTTLGVLGPLLLRGPAGPIRVASARQRGLLTALAAHLGHAVDAGALAELVWGADPPADPAGAVQTNVARLRRLLPPDVRLETTPEGYRLDVPRSAVDVTAFTDHLVAADAAPDPHARLDRLAAALALWRGRPFADLDHPSLEPEVARLAARRADAVERRAETLLALGRAGEAVAELEALVAAEPLREGAVGALMRALVATGRQGDALAAFARLRARLADELGLDPAPELRELEQQVLRQQLPRPARGVRDRATVRLPLSSFVGRDADLARVVGRLGACRVVTLCGPGGVGKTRLATHAAAAVAHRYPDGVVVVGFGDGGPADVEPLLAAALQVAEGAGDRIVDGIVAVLTPRRSLLLLDNCEHVADEVAPLVEAVAAAAPGVDLLLTSREPLRVDGEQVLPVAPLDPDAAARLLVDRIRAGDPDAAAEVDDALVAQVCRGLDGLPLALELAAARALPLGLPGLVEALADSEPIELLRGGRRTASPRHRSLRDVVAWSYGLLDERQRTLFARMAVFAGPVEPAAVAAVCGDAGALPDLVDRSLVVRDGARFGMLETLRAFGRSRLAVEPAADRLRARHAAWAVRLAEEVAAARRGPGEPAAIRRFDEHLADLRRAHAWLCANGPAEDLLRLAVPVAELAHLRSRADLTGLVEEAMAATDGAVHPLRARLLGLAAQAAWQRGDLAGGEEQARRAIAVADAAGEPTAGRDGHESLSNVLSFRGDLATAARHAVTARDLARAEGDTDVEVTALADLVVQTAYAGDDEASARYEAEMAAVVARCGSSTGRAYLAYARGERRAERGLPDAARHLQEAVDVAEEAGVWFVAGIARHTLLTRAARDAPDAAAALAPLAALIDHWHGVGAWNQAWIAVRTLVETLARLGRHRDAAFLLGALRAGPRASRLFGADSARAATVEAAARAALGPAFARLCAEGAALGDAEALALARRLARSAEGDGSSAP
jgi:predicted ATPase/DNA-binding SARP family transcriptional activator